MKTTFSLNNFLTNHNMVSTPAHKKKYPSDVPIHVFNFNINKTPELNPHFLRVYFSLSA